MIRRLFRINRTVFLHFNRQMMTMPWDEFIASLVEELDVAAVVVGHDFSFGYRGAGTPERLKSWCDLRGISCDVIPAVRYEGRVISSTEIRGLIAEGDIELANRLLGHPYELSGVVRSGFHIGQSLGSPTVNLFIPQDVLVPRYGVYATRVFLEDGSEYAAVTNVGVRPTVSDLGRVSVESHIIDFEGNLYGSRLRVEFHRFQRDEKKFDSPALLAEQIAEDISETRRCFAQGRNN